MPIGFISALRYRRRLRHDRKSWQQAVDCTYFRARISHFAENDYKLFIENTYALSDADGPLY